MQPVLALKSLSCKSITEDRFKRLWVSFDEGTNVIDLRTMLPVVPKTKNGDIGKLLSQPGVKVYADALGRIWLVTISEVTLLSFSEDGQIDHACSYRYIGNTPDVCLVILVIHLMSVWLMLMAMVSHGLVLIMVCIA